MKLEGVGKWGRERVRVTTPPEGGGNELRVNSTWTEKLPRKPKWVESGEKRLRVRGDKL